MKKEKKDSNVRMFISGAKGLLPLLLSSFPFGIIVGATAYATGIAGVKVVVFSLFVYAGAAQLAMMQLMDENAPVAIVIISALVINLRYLLYSAGLAAFFLKLSLSMRALLAYAVSDQSYGVFMMRRARRGESGKNFQALPAKLQVMYYLGATYFFFCSWQIAFYLGYYFGDVLTQGISIDFVVPLTFLTMLLATVTNGEKGMVLVALVSGSVALMVHRLPLNLGFLVSVFFGLLLALWFTYKKSRVGEKIERGIE